MSKWIIFYITIPKLGIPVEMVGPQFLFKLLLKKISCCTPRFPLILSAQPHSLYVKESEILERSRVGFGCLPLTLQPWFILMVKPVYACHLFCISFQFNLQFGTYSVDNAI